MTPTGVDQALATARECGFLVLDEEPRGLHSSQAQKRLLRLWEEHCQAGGRHRILIFPVQDRWAIVLGFGHGWGREKRYVRKEFTRAFVAWFGKEPTVDGPKVWCGATTRRSTAEALAWKLVDIDARPRDPRFETVFEVHER